MFSVLVLLAILSVTLAVDFDCGNYNNNCVSCIQATAKGNMAHSCSFCSVDGEERLLSVLRSVYDLSLCFYVQVSAILLGLCSTNASRRSVSVSLRQVLAK